MKLIRLLKHDLAAEVKSWIDDDCISHEQGQTILARYGTTLEEASRRRLGHLVLSGLAVLFFGIALILLVSHNWHEIPRAVRMMSLVLLTVASNGIGIYKWYQKKFDVARLWMIFGSLAYGASIFLIAQIYHLGEYYPNGILFWTAGIIPIAIFSQSMIVGLVASALAFTWLCVETQLGHLPWLYPLLSSALLFFSFRVRQSAPVFLFNVAGMLTFVDVVVGHLVSGPNHYGFEFDGAHLFVTGAMALGLYALGSNMELAKKNHLHMDYGVLLKVWSLRLGLVLLFIMSFEDPWRSVIRDLQNTGALSLTAVFLAVAIQAYFAWSTRVQNRKRYAGQILLGVMTLLANLHCMGVSHESAVTLQLMTNVALLGMGAYFIFDGSKSLRHSRVVLGTLILLVLAFLRYVSLIGDYIGASFLFLIGGAVLFAVGRFTRNTERKLEVQA